MPNVTEPQEPREYERRIADTIAEWVAWRAEHREELRDYEDDEAGTELALLDAVEALVIGWRMLAFLENSPREVQP